jgi:hypothetical protein
MAAVTGEVVRTRAIAGIGTDGLLDHGLSNVRVRHTLGVCRSCQQQHDDEGRPPMQSVHRSPRYGHAGRLKRLSGCRKGYFQGRFFRTGLTVWRKRAAARAASGRRNIAPTNAATRATRPARHPCHKKMAASIPTSTTLKTASMRSFKRPLRKPFTARERRRAPARNRAGKALAEPSRNFIKVRLHCQLRASSRLASVPLHGVP